MAEPLPAIYLVVGPDCLWPEDTRAEALTEDGRILASHIYSDTAKAKGADVARSRVANARRLYRSAYPAGYRLVWPEDDPEGFAAAKARADALWEQGREARQREIQALMEQRAAALRAVAARSAEMSVAEVSAMQDELIWEDEEE